MSFSFSAAGTRDETLSSLRKADPSADSAGPAVRDMLVSYLTEADGDLPEGFRYEVSAYGHSGPGQLLSLGVTVAVKRPTT